MKPDSSKSLAPGPSGSRTSKAAAAYVARATGAVGVVGAAGTLGTADQASNQSVGNSASEAGKSKATVRPSSFAGHYGQLIITEGISPIPRALYLYQGALKLSPQQVWFISCVLSYKWNFDLPHPRLQELARHATLGLRQIKKIKNSIVHLGLLEVASRYGAEGEQDSNSYDFGLLFDKLESLMAGDPSAPVDELSERPLQNEQARLGTPGRGSGPGAAEVALGTNATSATSATSATKGTTEEDRKDYSFAARYGRVLLRRGVAAIPKALFTYQAGLGLSPQQLWFIGYILSFQWSIELPYPSLRKMALNTGYSERQIHRIKDALVSAGYLRVVERRGVDGRHTTSAYDFSELLKTLSTLIRKHSSEASGKVASLGKPEEGEAIREVREVREGVEAKDAQRGSDQLSSDSLQAWGEPYVSGGVNAASVAREPDGSGRANHASEGGVNPVSVGRVNSASYEIESDKEEPDKEEPHQQQPPELEQAQENAYYTLVDVGVIPATALEIAHRVAPDEILDWIRYYLSVLCKQDNLSNPLGVLVSRLRSGEEPPYVPSTADLQSLRFQLSRYQWKSE